MANAEANMPLAEKPKKSGLKGMIIGLFFAALLGSGGFYAVWSGLLLGPHDTPDAIAAPAVPGLPNIAFVPIAPILVSLGPGSNARHLRFQAQLEVEKAFVDDVTMLLPRVIDVLNGYLRAVEPDELEAAGALTMIRSQMLRRAQIVVGDGRVRDLLIMEFVLN